MSKGIYNIFEDETLDQKAFNNSEVFRGYQKNMRKLDSYLEKEAEEKKQKKVAQTTKKIESLLKEAELQAEQLFGGEIGDKLEELKEKQFEDYSLDPKNISDEIESSEEPSFNDEVIDQHEESSDPKDFQHETEKDFWDSTKYKPEESWVDFPEEDDENLRQAEVALGLNLNAAYILAKLEKRGY